MSEDADKTHEFEVDRGVVETAADFLRRRAGEARPAGLIAFLDRAGDAPPSASDEPLKAS